jgi:pimeloyl-ACP methyl ester carboxylesterase
MAAREVLLVHGLGSSFEHGWVQTGWVDILTSEGHDPVAVHLPGHGPAGSADEDTDAVARILAEARAHRPMDAVGFSAGAVALLAAAVQDPGAFRRIALLGIGDPRGDVGDVTAIADGLESDDEPSDDVPRIIRRLAVSAGNDRHAVARYLRADSRSASLSDVREVDRPVLVVLGDRDFAGPADALVAALPSADLVTLHGVDHFATPGTFAAIDAVVRFLAD